MIQSPEDQRHPDGSCLASTRYHYAFIYRVCLILLVTLALAYGLFMVKSVPLSSGLSVDQTRSKALKAWQVRVNAAPAPQLASIHRCSVPAMANEPASLSVASAVRAKFNHPF